MTADADEPECPQAPGDVPEEPGVIGLIQFD
jgi:hypothetical protein